MAQWLDYQAWPLRPFFVAVWYNHASRPSGAEGWRSGVPHPLKAWSPLRPFFVAVRRLSSYADAAMRSVLIRLCLVAVYVLVLLEVGMVLGAVT